MRDLCLLKYTNKEVWKEGIDEIQTIQKPGILSTPPAHWLDGRWLCKTVEYDRPWHGSTVCSGVAAGGAPLWDRGCWLPDTSQGKQVWECRHWAWVSPKSHNRHWRWFWLFPNTVEASRLYHSWDVCYPLGHSEQGHRVDIYSSLPTQQQCFRGEHMLLTRHWNDRTLYLKIMKVFLISKVIQQRN